MTQIKSKFVQVVNPLQECADYRWILLYEINRLLVDLVATLSYSGEIKPFRRQNFVDWYCLGDRLNLILFSPKS